MCGEAVDDSLAALKLIPDWFFTSKMIKKLCIALYSDENIFYFNKDSGNVVFSGNGMGILIVDLDSINLYQLISFLVGYIWDKYICKCLKQFST